MGNTLARCTKGQANAAATSRTASTRRTKRSRLRRRKGLRRAIGWSSRNWTAENWTRFVSFRRRKCSQIGAATARAPSHNQGWKKEIMGESSKHQAPSTREAPNPKRQRHAENCPWNLEVGASLEL